MAPSVPYTCTEQEEPSWPRRRPTASKHDSPPQSESASSRQLRSPASRCRRSSSLAALDRAEIVVTERASTVVPGGLLRSACLVARRGRTRRRALARAARRARQRQADQGGVSLRIEPLADGYDLERSPAGTGRLTLGFMKHAHTATRQGTRTYLLLEGRDRTPSPATSPSPRTSSSAQRRRGASAAALRTAFRRSSSRSSPSTRTFRAMGSAPSC